jgi:FMN phosphatase YigB (HAD superfamily)
MIYISNKEIWQLLRKSYEIAPDILKLVALLKEKNYLLCICSNNFPTRIRELDEEFSFLSLFDVCVFS